MQIWSGFSVHEGQIVKFGHGSREGTASYCTKANECKLAESGILTIAKYGNGSNATGHYELHFEDGKTLKGTFDMKGCLEHVLCG